MPLTFLPSMPEFNLWSVLDILIVAFVVYQLLMLLKGTRAVQLIRGLVVLLLASYLSQQVNLSTIQWILSSIWGIIFVAMAVVFQPELRRALEQLGRGKFLFGGIGEELNAEETEQAVSALVSCAVSCAKTKTGILIVLEQSIGLNDYIETGIAIDARASESLLANVFVKNTPLHDGAAIIRGDRIMAAACFLPLSDNPYLSVSLGTRHRAAIGISEVSDAISIVVSEETGIISVAKEGTLMRYLDEKQLRELLSDVYSSRKTLTKRLWSRRDKKA